MPETPPTAQELYDAWLIAYRTALTTGQSVSFNGRTWTSHDLMDLAAVGPTLLAAITGTGGAVTRVAAYCKGV